MNTKRIDVLLFEKGLCKSRERAKQLIKNGNITVNGSLCVKPSLLVDENADIQVNGDIHRYVGRGGLKLEKAVSTFGISLEGAVCLDIGASTGGFTDCMLQNGAKLVYALDVGHSQLDAELLADSRIVNMEKTNIRDTLVSDFPENINFIAADVSFISIKLVLPKIKELLSENGSAVVLVKPQFEAGRENLNKQGVVKDPAVHRHILNDITLFASEIGFHISGLCVSPIKGGTGNSEYLMYLEHLVSDNSVYLYNIDGLVNEALKKE